ncbi:hypothetical protein [Glutamicibacter protophormiae]|uniref:Knr4/Smi1-like domain-containing protein n=1 Tax=Glutamicibacter protophormiae TaxID=37930 RepID=A0ABS4XV99_GLUPR|nr:hypothetical protein [Glutamicibacter protophormiae]MBP2400435.1 hypothetical protein [Glutamicibacter protophormiae]QRQ77718.1 hypothetical protein JQN66_12375 [Glutamicibacter protophormiae]WPR63726.1 hypothetical protein SLW72_12645 [Glutamicibacter protophormiae]WPR67221.1 hypothetical protein SLW73_12640 [Glutamicibacter protophormiae]GGL94315.1 hypothetical protein GCM10010038_25600 [Glutamicibacter protophormiae]
MADMFLEKFRSLVPKYLEDQWNEADGLTAGELADGLAESKVQIPFVLEEFYLALGNNDDFMEAYHYFFDPEELEIDDGYLLFLEDEEEKFVWGFKQSQLEVPDPIVYRRSNAKGNWVSEEGTFSEFTLDMFAWVFEELAAELED